MKAISKLSFFFATRLKRQLLHAMSLTKLVHFCKIMTLLCVCMFSVCDV